MGEAENKAEYDGWYSPRDVIVKYKDVLPSDTVARLIANQLEDGLMRSIAEQLVSQPKPTRRYAELAPSAWKRWAFLNDQHFWTVGMLERYSGTSFNLPSFRAYAVRLERQAVDRLILGASSPQTQRNDLAKALTDYKPTTPPAPVTPSRRNPVTTSEIDGWFQRLSAAHRSEGIRDLWARAKRDHPGRHLPRKMVEPFVKNRPTGPRRTG